MLEVLMATFVMGFGISTAIIALQAGFRHLDLARGTTQASQIIQSEMERIRMMSWADVGLIPPTATFDGASIGAVPLGKYAVTRTRTPDMTRPTEVMNLKVSVTWQTYDGRPHTRSFNSNYVRNGLYDYYYTVAHP